LQYARRSPATAVLTFDKPEPRQDNGVRYSRRAEPPMEASEAPQKIVQSRRAVEIETLNAHAEVEPLLAMAEQLRELRSHGDGALELYIRNVRLGMFAKTGSVITSAREGSAGR
ncbi:hypothetical protein, partial [Dactylosporangium darangshiense]|uniref:hypothetical protein n=1 Tax=Dactylosporangium darangshiense TaxID=579108 RepID=UPI0031EF8B81